MDIIKNSKLNILNDLNGVDRVYTLPTHSYHFQKNGTQYRIAYEVLEDNKIIFHYMVATRENFYKKLENRV